MRQSKTLGSLIADREIDNIYSLLGEEVGEVRQTYPSLELGAGGGTSLPSYPDIYKGGTFVGKQPILNLIEGTGITLTITDNGSNDRIDITIAGTAALDPATTVTDVGASGVVGTAVEYAREDHVHEGVHSLAKSGSSQLTGDVTLSAGANVTLTQSGNDIEIASSSGGNIGTISETFDYLDFNATPSTNTTFTLSTQLPAGAVIFGYKIKHSTAFGGGTLSAVTAAAEVVTGSTTTTSSAHNVFSAVADDKVYGGLFGHPGKHANANDLLIRMTTTGGDLTALTAGELTITFAYWEP